MPLRKKGAYWAVQVIGTKVYERTNPPIQISAGEVVDDEIYMTGLIKLIDDEETIVEFGLRLGANVFRNVQSDLRRRQQFGEGDFLAGPQ